MTKRGNVAQILHDQRIRRFNMPGTFFFRKPYHAILYSDFTSELDGRCQTTTDKDTIQLAPVKPEDLLILEIVPKRREPHHWFVPVPVSDPNQFPFPRTKGTDAMAYIQLFHYGDLTAKDIRLISYSELYYNRKYHAAMAALADFGLITHTAVCTDYPYIDISDYE